MKSKKAQMEFEPVGILMGIIGAVLAWIMSSRMEAGFAMKLISTLITGVVCYFIAAFIANK